MEAEGGAGAGGPFGGGAGFYSSSWGGGGGGAGPFSAESIFEQFLRSESGWGQFFSGNMFVESSMRLTFMVRRVAACGGRRGSSLLLAARWTLRRCLLAGAVRGPFCMHASSCCHTAAGAVALSKLHWLAAPLLLLSVQEAAKGTRKRVDLSKVLGTQLAPVEVDIPPGVDSGQQIQVRRACRHT